MEDIIDLLSLILLDKPSVANIREDIRESVRKIDGERL